MDSSIWRKVLVVQTSFLGDTVLTMPLFAEIKDRFPQAHLSILCGTQGRDLLNGQPEIDEIIVDDKRNRDKGWSGLRRKASELKERNFTLALSPHKSLRSALLLFFAGIPYRVGFRQSKGWFLFHSTVERDPRRHDVERNLSILEAFGIAPEDCRRNLQLEITSRAQESVDRLFRSVGVDGGRLLLGVNPGSVWPTKRWPAEGYASLLDLLRQRYDCQIALFGGPEDAPTAARIQRLSSARTVNLVGKIPLSELPAALRRCRALITNDSGPMHIAVAAGVPVAAVFCATTPALGFYPYSSRAVVVEKQLPCRPCSSHGGRRCPLGTEDCMRLVRPDDVLLAVEKLLTPNEEAESTAEPSFMPRFVTL